jgi:hypothetical protein
MKLTPFGAPPVINAVNRGIDSRLEGFTESSFEWIFSEPLGLRLVCNIANQHEFQVLVRRLLELEDENAEGLADDLIYDQFDVEPI